MRVTFFCFAKRKSPKKRRPPVCDPCASLRGRPASCRLRGAPWNSLRCVAASFRHPRRVRARSTHAPTRVPPRSRPAAGAARRGGTAEHPNSPTGHCFARPRLRSAWRLRPRFGAERSDDVLLAVPLWMRRGAQGLADQGSRVSERRAAARVERDPAKPEHRRLPRSVSAGDADSGVAFLLGTFLWRSKEKCLACRATPGPRPQPRHRDRFIQKAQKPQPSPAFLDASCY
ncbi:hypothetical protein CLU87_3603 [Acidovorax sp. 59]|nr:hypothetical protein CLU87_3603 [Acidovorax sp. 59]